MVTPTAAQVLTDDKLFHETFILIDTREGSVIPFKYNPAQELLYSELTPRHLVVKSRQMGITTFLLARGFKKVITEKNVNAVIVANEEILTQRLLRRVQVMYDRLPIPDHLKPVMAHSSSYEKTFPSRNTTFYIGTAGSKVFGRGLPIHYFLGSEVAFWPDAWNILGPVMDSVPRNGELILETTPNGTGTDDDPNIFHELVQEALGSNSTWGLTTLFWYREPYYRLKLGAQEALPRDRGHITEFSQEEINLAKLAKWDDLEAEERIRWRRTKIREKHSLFWQEYVEDIRSCFFTVGEPFYEPDVLMRLRVLAIPPTNYLRLSRIWHEPDKDTNAVYVVSVDPGQGKITSSVATVWRLDLENFTKIRHEATLAGLYDSIAFAPMVMELARYYHSAKIIPEANGHGLAFCAEVKNYENLYYRTHVISGVSSKEVGWLTTGPARMGATGTKIYMLSELQSLLPIIDTQDLDLINELSQVKYAGQQIVYPGSGDYLMSAAIMAATRGGMVGHSSRGYIGSAGWGLGW